MSTRTLWVKFRVNQAELDQLREQASPLTVPEWLRELAGLKPVEWKFSAERQPETHGGGWPKGKRRSPRRKREAQ